MDESKNFHLYMENMEIYSSESCNSDSECSSEKSFIQSLEDSEEKKHGSFINDFCDFCGLQCGSQKFLEVLEDDNLILQYKNNKQINEWLLECNGRCPMCNELSNF